MFAQYSMHSDVKVKIVHEVHEARDVCKRTNLKYIREAINTHVISKFVCREIRFGCSCFEVLNCAA